MLPIKVGSETYVCLCGALLVLFALVSSETCLATGAEASHASKTGDKVAEQAAHKESDKVTEHADHKVSDKASEHAAHKAGDKASEHAAHKAGDKASEHAAHKAGDKATDKLPDKATDKAADKATDKAADKAPEDNSWKDYLNAAKKFYSEGKLADAANQLELALAGSERLREGPRGEAFMLIGEQFLYLKQYEKAKTLLEESLSLRRKIPGFKSLATANGLDTLAQAYSRTGNLEGAKKAEIEALTTYESLKKTDTQDYVIILSNHANTLRNMHEYKEAEQFFAKAVSAQQKLEKSDSIELAKILLNAGGLYCEMDKLDSAARLLDRAQKIVQSKLTPQHPLYKLSTKSQRVLFKKKVDALMKKDPNPLREEVAVAVSRLGELYEEEGDPSQAAEAFKQALAIRQKLSPDSPELQKVQQSYESNLKKLSTGH